MSNRDPFEELLSGMNRPVQPRPEFEQALEHRLMAELGSAEPSGKGLSYMSESAATSRTWRVSAEPESNRRRWLPVLEIAAVVLIAIGIGAGVLASRGMLPGQSNDNKAALTIQYPITPDPSECTVEPRTVEEVEALVPDQPDYSSNPDIPTREPTATPPLDLRHSPADEETAREIEAAYREWVACLNAGDALRYAALLSDDLLRTGSFDLTSFETPIPEEDRLTILDISYLREFDDGRAGGVLVIAPNSFPAAISPQFFIFTKEGDHWLLDGFPMWWASSVEGDSDVEVVDGEENMLPTVTPVSNELLIETTNTPEDTPTVIQNVLLPTETPEP
jgi:hypothetical protein